MNKSFLFIIIFLLLVLGVFGSQIVLDKKIDSDLATNTVSDSAQVILDPIVEDKVDPLIETSKNDKLEDTLVESIRDDDEFLADKDDLEEKEDEKIEEKIVKEESVLSPIDPEDKDGDGVPDRDELAIYKTDISSSDTDGDGFSDWIELNTGFSPHNPKSVKLKDNDLDGDGLSDRMELNFHTDLSNEDTDGDGFKDGLEIEMGFDPNGTSTLEKRIEVNTGAQEASIFLGGVKLKTFVVSTGRPGMDTPKGHHVIINKIPRPWSSAYGLWMPYWLGMLNGKYGFHELPEWPGGYKEGQDHLGIPVSHGCIRLGIGDAEYLYNWAEVGTKVFVY